MNTGWEQVFIVSYRTREGTRFRTEVSGMSWREVRTLYKLNGHILPDTLVVQPMRHIPTSGIQLKR